MEPVVQPDYTKAREEVKSDKGRTPANYQVTKKLLFEKAKSDAIVLHSLPRQDELSPGRGQYALPALLGRGLQRRADAHVAAGADPGRGGISDLTCGA